MDQYSRKSEFPDSVWWKHLTENFNGICETLLVKKFIHVNYVLYGLI
jgi:hypothetical protein